MLYPRRKSPRHPLDRRLGGPQSRSGRRGGEKILNPTGTRIPTPGRPACSQSLYRLLQNCGTTINQNYSALTKKLFLTYSEIWKKNKKSGRAAATKHAAEHWKKLSGKLYRKTGLSTELRSAIKRRGRHLMKPLLRQVNILMFRKSWTSF
jgi:hypothetical protein